MNVNVKNDKRVSKPWAVHTTLSQLQDTGSLPGSQPSMHLEMHRSVPNSPHMAIHSILKKTNYGLQSRTSGGLEQHQDGASDRKHSDVNDKINKKASNKETAHKTPSQRYKEENLMCIKMHKTECGPQMAVLPIQQQPDDGLTVQGVGGLKLCHSDAVDRKRSKANIKTIKKISEHGTTHDALSIIHNKGDLPIPQHPTRSKTCNESMHSPQLAMSLSLLEGLSSLLEGSSSWSLDRTERCLGDVLYEKHLNMNIGPVKSLTKLSEEWEEQDEYEYSPVKEPKVLDKKARHTRQNEMSRRIRHLDQRQLTMPETQWRESEVTQSVNSHTSYDSMCKRVNTNEQQCVGGTSTKGKVINLPADNIEE